MKQQLKRLSICKCGFPVLNESIGLDTIYDIDPDSIRSGYIYRCGGCSTVQYNVSVINANQILNPNLASAPVPYELFF
jgi:hypothetical protein